MSISPSTATVAPGGTRAFTAAVSGSGNTAVTWSIQEGATGGSITGTGQYTAPTHAGVYHVIATSQADATKSGSATVTVNDPAPVNGAAMTTANRTSGVAPLSVFFDCVDTVPEGIAAPFTWTSGVYQPADGDYEGMTYKWDFGDANAGAWNTTGISKNVATGYTAAHVYEAPGTYTASLTITDKSGTVRTYNQTITVQAFSGTTYYVAANGDDVNNDGLSEGAPFLTAAKGLEAVNGANRRVLFRRGDQFPIGSTPIISANGPGIIGAYGSGERPVISSTAATGILVRGSDWRVMDLDFPSSTGGASAIDFDVSVQSVNTLQLRLRATGWQVGLGWGDYTPIYATPHDGAAVVECEVASPTLNGMYLGGRRLALLGNDIHDVGQSHVLRVWQAHKGVISHNRLWNPGPTRHALKMHGPGFGDGRPETRWVTVSDNRVRGRTWAMAIGPQDGGKDERLSHVVVERNRTWGEGSIQVDLIIWARQVMVRNNVFDGTGSNSGYTSVHVGQRGIEPAANEVRLLNNTMVRWDGGDFQALGIGAVAVENLVFRNNLVSAPAVANPYTVYGTPGAGFVSDHNLLTATPGFSDAAAGNYSLLATSLAVDAGLSLPEVLTDFSGTPRPLAAGYDIGAHESH